MKIAHDQICANRHTFSQEPNDTLRKSAMLGISTIMATDFRAALLWHMEQHETSISDLVSATGVSRHVINKLRSREGSSTTAENAILIAAFFGKSVNDFISLRPATESSRTLALLDLLRPEEQRLLQAQIRGLLSERVPE